MVKGSPSSYSQTYVDHAYKLCVDFGADDKALAKFFAVDERTINNWKHDHSDFFQSIKRGKEEFDTKKVEASLLKRALGYDFTSNKHDGISMEPNTTKHIPPDVGAIIFWLKNRNPKRWSNSN